MSLTTGQRLDEAAKDRNKVWSRGIYHDILEQVFEPLQTVQKDGVNLMCPDGERRLCFPVLSQYICDYQEKFMITGITFGSCAFCTIPSYRHPDKEATKITAAVKKYLRQASTKKRATVKRVQGSLPRSGLSGHDADPVSP